MTLLDFILLYLKIIHLVINKILNNLENRPIYQPELSTYMFYGNNNELKIIDYKINNKFIKRETYIKTLNILKNLYLNIYITFMEDTLINFIIYKIAKSFYFLKKFGYYYLRNSISITKNIKKISYLKYKFIFLNLKIIYYNSKETKYDKDIANYLFIKLNKFNLNKISFFKKDLYLFKNIVDIYIKNKFVTDENKYILNKIFKKINKKIH